MFSEYSNGERAEFVHTYPSPIFGLNTSQTNQFSTDFLQIVCLCYVDGLMVVAKGKRRIQYAYLSSVNEFVECVFEHGVCVCLCKR